RDQHGNDCSASAHGIDPLIIGGAHGEAAQLDITCARAGSLSRPGLLLDTTLFRVSSSNEQTSDQALMLLGLPLLAAVALASQASSSPPRQARLLPPLGHGPAVPRFVSRSPYGLRVRGTPFGREARRADLQRRQ